MRPTGQTGWALALLAALVVGLDGVPARASELEAQAAVRASLGAARAIVVSDVSRPEKVAALEEVSAALLDTRSIGLRAIGPRLAAQSEADQREFMRLFDELMIRSYLTKLLLFRNPRFDFGPPEPAGARVRVPTFILSGGDRYTADYAMHRNDAGWRAEDVVIEGRSLTELWRFQFDGILRERSFEELLDLMRRKSRRQREKDGRPGGSS